MIDFFLLLLNQQRSDILFAIKLRKSERAEKHRLICSKCPCCVQRMIRNTYMLGDQDLILEITKIDQTIEDITSEINLDQIL